MSDSPASSGSRTKEREGANSTTHAKFDREDGQRGNSIVPNPPRVEVFHKGTVGKNIAKALADYVKDVPDEIQEIVIATHAVLPYIKHFENKDKWHVFVDEAMQVVRYQQHQIPHNHHLHHVTSGGYPGQRHIWRGVEWLMTKP